MLEALIISFPIVVLLLLFWPHRPETCAGCKSTEHMDWREGMGAGFWHCKKCDPR